MKVTVSIDQTPEELAKLAKNIRQLAQQQRYHNDESCMVSCADIIDRIVLELAPEPVPENSVHQIEDAPGMRVTEELCPICNQPSELGPHQACIDKLVDGDESDEVPT